MNRPLTPLTNAALISRHEIADHEYEYTKADEFVEADFARRLEADLRDRFAAAAMSAAVELMKLIPRSELPRNMSSYDAYGQIAYLLADAMLKAREA